MADTLPDHRHELEASFSVWSPSTASAAALHPSVKLHFVCNTIYRFVALHDESQIATRSQPLMAYRHPLRFHSTTKLDRSTLLSLQSTATVIQIILSKLLEYYGDGLLQWRGLQSLLSDIYLSIRSLILRRPTNRVRVHVDFHYYHVSYAFLPHQSFDGMKPASKSATMEMLKKVDKNHLLDDDERCTVCLEELGREDEEVLCMPCLHRFHGQCILKWLDNNHYCPICRFPMPTQ
nr:E3 ubiquitin-protein ligase CIP8-like [Ipomoea trifida]